MESFWGRMQVELLDRRRWKTRVELATAIYDYIELWHNTRRRHSSLAMRARGGRTRVGRQLACDGPSAWRQDRDNRRGPRNLSLWSLCSRDRSDPSNHHLLNNNSNDQAA